MNPEPNNSDTPLPRKVRADSKWHLLKPGQQQALRDLEARGVMRKKQLTYFAECTGEKWTEKGLCEFWQSERDHENAVLASIKRTRAVAAEIVSEDKRTGVTLEEATAKKLTSIWALIADALLDPTSPEGLALLDKATNGIWLLNQPQEKKAVLAERKEARAQRAHEAKQRFASKVEAGLKQIESEVAKNPKVRAAVEKVREAMKAEEPS